MRQGQQNKRMRGRGRKPSSPLNRVFESNGPDVKIRGPASHIAEKYLTLARDAQSSGDPISAENYLQHAEHYFRIISSAQTQAQQPSPPQPNQPQPVVDQPGGELNGAAQGSRRGDDGGDEPRAEASGDQRKEAGAEDRKQDGAEDVPQKPRRRRSPDARARSGNGHDKSSKQAAAEQSSGDDDSPATDAEPGVEKPAESAA